MVLPHQPHPGHEPVPERGAPPVDDTATVAGWPAPDDPNGHSDAAPAGQAEVSLGAFSDDVRNLRMRGGRLRLSERTLMIIGGIIAPIGLVLIMLGWVGASRTTNTFEQIPYMISGGLLGLALVFLGAIFYFAHWLTELVREHRRQSADLIAAVGRLQEELAATAARVDGRAGRTPADQPAEPAELVATERGSMAHRADCPAVAGKRSLRRVNVDDGMAPCKLCDPYTGDDPILDR